MNIALMAHDNKKELMIQFCIAYCGILAKHTVCGTGTTAENRMRILRLIENLSLGAGAVGYRTESLHGAGSPQAQRVMIARQGDIAGKKVLAKRIARVKED